MVLPVPIALPLPSTLSKLYPPRKIETLLLLKLAVAKSCIPSWLKSPMAIKLGSVPTTVFILPLNVPKPSPNEMETLSLFLLAMAIS